MADDSEKEKGPEEFDTADLLVGGATWGGRDRRRRPRAEGASAQGEENGDAAAAPASEPALATPPAPEPAPEPEPEPVSEPAPVEPAPPANGGTADPYRWRRPEEVIKSENAEPGERRGLVKQKGAGTGFVLPTQEEPEEKPKRGLFQRQPRPEKLKVERPREGRGEAPTATTESRLVRGRAAKYSRLRVPVKRHHIAVISGSGGVGKTTAAAMLGWLLGEARNGGVALVESMPAGGAVAHRLGIDLEWTSADLFRIADYAKGLADVQAMTQKFAHLEVVGTSSEPRLADILDPGEQERVLDLVIRSYPLVVSDNETGLLAARTTTTLEYADQIVFCMSTDVATTWRASSTLGWLIHQGGQAADLARRTVVLATELHPGTLGEFELAKEQISSRCRAVLTAPYDPQFAAGGPLDLSAIADPTYEAYLDLAVELAHSFGVIAR